jgi:hypothetical protein
VSLTGVYLQRESLSRAALNQRFPFFGGIDQAQLGKRLSSPISNRCETLWMRCLDFSGRLSWPLTRPRVAHQHLEARARLDDGGPSFAEETEQAA